MLPPFLQNINLTTSGATRSGLMVGKLRFCSVSQEKEGPAVATYASTKFSNMPGTLILITFGTSRSRENVIGAIFLFASIGEKKKLNECWRSPA